MKWIASVNDSKTHFISKWVSMFESFTQTIRSLTHSLLAQACTLLRESLKTPPLMYRQFFVMFLLLLSITYTHIWYLYGLKILWYYHGTHSNKRHDLRNHQCLEHERCTTNLYLCWWYKQSSNTMCEQQKQWRLAYGALLAGSVWLHYE